MKKIKGLPPLPTGFVWRSGNVVKVGEGIVNDFGGVRYAGGRLFWIGDKLYVVYNLHDRTGASSGYVYEEHCEIDESLIEKEEPKKKIRNLSWEEIERGDET